MENYESISKTVYGSNITFTIKRSYAPGVKPGEYWTSNESVYLTLEDSASAAKEKMAGWSNLVFLGHEKIMIDGDIYYHPTFNVWD